LGRVYAAKGMMVKALEEFREALRLHPDDSDLAEFVEQLELKLQ
jgi:cytochrome c-type biogenesis protein CcmH/NrfG